MSDVFNLQYQFLKPNYNYDDCYFHWPDGSKTSGFVFESISNKLEHLNFRRLIQIFSACVPDNTEIRCGSVGLPRELNNKTFSRKFIEDRFSIGSDKVTELHHYFRKNRLIRTKNAQDVLLNNFTFITFTLPAKQPKDANIDLNEINSSISHALNSIFMNSHRDYAITQISKEFYERVYQCFGSPFLTSPKVNRLSRNFRSQKLKNPTCSQSVRYFRTAISGINTEDKELEKSFHKLHESIGQPYILSAMWKSLSLDKQLEKLEWIRTLEQLKIKKRPISQNIDSLFITINAGDSVVLIDDLCLSIVNTDSKSTQLLIKTLEDKNPLLSWSEQRFSLNQCKSFQKFFPFTPYGTNKQSPKELMSLDNLVKRLPLYGEWSGADSNVMEFQTINKRHLNFDVFDSNTYYSCACIGFNGFNGFKKEILINKFIEDYLSIGAKIDLIGFGSSFIPPSLRKDHETVLDINSTPLNPFRMKIEASDINSIAIPLVNAMTGEDELSEVEEVALGEVVYNLYKFKGKDLLIDDIMKECLLIPKLKSIGSRLKSFTSKGPFGACFASKETSSITKDLNFISANLDGLQENLSNALYLMILQAKLFEIKNSPNDVKKLLFINNPIERIKKSSTNARYFEHLYRSVRQKGCSIITFMGHQNRKLAHAEISILEYSPHLILGSNAKGIERVLDHRGTGTNMLNQLKLLNISNTFFISSFYGESYVQMPLSNI